MPYLAYDELLSPRIAIHAILNKESFDRKTNGLLTALSLIPQVGGLCNHLYRQSTEPLLKAFFPEAYLQLRADDAHPETIRVEFASKAQIQAQMAQAKQGGGAVANITGKDNLVNFHNLFLSFFLFYVALVLLSPISWKGKIGSLLLGSLLFYGYTVFKLSLQMLSIFNQPDIAICQTSPSTLGIAEGTLSLMTLGTNVLLVLMLWAVLVLRKGNWRGMLQTGP